MKLSLKKSFYLLPLLFAGCQHEDSVSVNQKRIFTEYELFYDENADKTTAKVYFKFGNRTGTLLKLSDPSTVTFEGEKLLYNETLSLYYKDYSGKKLSGTFVFTDTDKKTYANIPPEMVTAEFPTLDTLRKGSSYDFKWIGTPLIDNEVISLLINGKSAGDYQYFESRSKGASSIVLEKDKLANLETASGTGTLDRSKDGSLQQLTEAGGVISTKYRAFKNFYIK